MTNPYLAHPNEDALERFLMRRSDEQELEIVETHIMACESCVTRLERMELEIADLQVALQDARQSQAAVAFASARPTLWQRWFTVPNLSWAGAACAALAVAFLVAPATRHHGSLEPAAESISACAASDMSLSACRGKETAVLPVNRPLELKVDTTDIASGSVDAQVVDANGAELWHGLTAVQNQRAAVNLPAIPQAGVYLLRLYSTSTSAEHELLREFRFQIQ